MIQSDATVGSLIFQASNGVEYTTVNLHVSEAINAVFVATGSIVTSSILSQELAGLVGKPGCFLFSVVSKERNETHIVCHGIVRSVQAQPFMATTDMFCWEISVVPWLDLLKNTINSRIFQEVPLDKMIEEVVSEYAFEHKLTFITQPETVKTLCIQHQESDYDFITRLLFEEGYHFYFVSDKTANEMIIGQCQPELSPGYKEKNLTYASPVNYEEGHYLESWLQNNAIVRRRMGIHGI